jgi:hypothetical protein
MKNHIKEDRRTFPVLRLQRSPSITCFTTVACDVVAGFYVEGVAMLKQRKKVNFLKVIEWNLQKDEVDSDRFGSHSLL